MEKNFLDRFESGLGKLIEELEATRIKLTQAETEADGLRVHTADRDRLDQRVKDLEAQLANVSTEELDSLRGDLENATNRIAEIEGDRNGIAAHRDQLQGEVNALQARIGEIENEKAGVIGHRDQLQNELNEARASLEALGNEKNGIAAHRDQLQGEVHGLNNRLGEIENEKNGIAGHRDQLQGELDGLRNRITELENEKNGIAASRDQLQDELNGLRHRLGELEHTSAGHHSEMEALRNELNAANDRANKADTELEEALNMAEEGDALRGVVVELKDKLEAALQREVQMKERLGMLIGRIEQTELILDSVEAGSHGES